MQAKTKPIQALIIRKTNNKLRINGPVTADKLLTVTNADFVLLLCGHDDVMKPENQADMQIFRNCTSSSPLLEEAQCGADNVRTIGYMLGTILEQEIKNEELLLFDDVEYLG